MTAPAMYCRICGKALTEEEKGVPGNIHCSVCAPATQGAPTASAVAPPPASVPPESGISPGLAFLLGLIPGVGAIYNGQYAKGLIHVVIFGLLLSIVSSDTVRGDLEPLFVLLVPTWIFYMAFEAYHTAKRRLSGEAVDEFSSLVQLRGRRGFPAGPVLIIAVGIIFLLHNLEIIRIAQLLRFWPVFLIGLGVYLLYNRLAEAGGKREVSEVSHEQ